MQLKSKLKDIENSLAERELHTMSENLRQEYDRQLVNIRNLRALYEERARISAAEKENLNRQLETSRAELNAAVEKYILKWFIFVCVCLVAVCLVFSLGLLKFQRIIVRTTVYSLCACVNSNTAIIEQLNHNYTHLLIALNSIDMKILVLKFQCACVSYLNR